MSSPAPEELEAPPPPQGHVRIVYLGPVEPHWEVQSEFGERSVIEEVRQRALARLLLLPPQEPQFRRNRERVARDAEREALILEWDLGIPEEEDEQAPATEGKAESQAETPAEGQADGQGASG